MGESKHFSEMMHIRCSASHGPAPIPEEGKWIKADGIEKISGFSHGTGTCGMNQGVVKLTLNVKEGVIKEALIETVGCSGLTHAAAMASEIIVGKTIYEALTTDLACDAIAVAFKEFFLNITYGRTQSAFSDGGLAIGSAFEDLGGNARSQTGTCYSTEGKGPRYLELSEGYVTELALDQNDQIIGYRYLNFGKMMDLIKKGEAPEKALKMASGSFGRVENAVKLIDPRRE